MPELDDETIRLLEEAWYEHVTAEPLPTASRDRATFNRTLWETAKAAYLGAAHHVGFRRDPALEAGIRECEPASSNRVACELNLIREYARRLQACCTGRAGGCLPNEIRQRGGCNHRGANLASIAILDAAGLHVSVIDHGDVVALIRSPSGNRWYLEIADPLLQRKLTFYELRSRRLRLHGGASLHLLTEEDRESLDDTDFTVLLEIPLPQGAVYWLTQQAIIRSAEREAEVFGARPEDQRSSRERRWIRLMEMLCPSYQEAIRHPRWQAELQPPRREPTAGQRFAAVVCALSLSSGSEAIFNQQLTTILLDHPQAVEEHGAVLLEAVLRGTKLPAHVPRDLAELATTCFRELMAGGPALWGDLPIAADLKRALLESFLTGDRPA